MQPFKVQFAKNYYYNAVTLYVRKYNRKVFWKRLLNYIGIYNLHISKIISKPTQQGNYYTYNCKLIKTEYYVFWIKVKTVVYDLDDK